MPSSKRRKPKSRIRTAKVKGFVNRAYRVTKQGLLWDKPMKDGPVTVLLTNFTAKIVSEIREDDGAETRLLFEIEAELNERRERFRVLADRFQSMSWVVEKLGGEAIIYPRFMSEDHVRVAIQELSGGIPRHTVYTHTGWEKIGDDWAYLHNGGGIGQNGIVPGIEVHLPEQLQPFDLPVPFHGAKLSRTVRASLRWLNAGPRRITIPLLAAVCRAIIGGADFSLHISGPTGAGKSELSALAQQHFGPGLDRRHLPGSWSSTGNALEALAFAAKDALLVVDDFAPGGPQQDVQRYHRDADRLLRAQGNHSGRLRMRSDATLRPAKPPRGLILSTGEDIPGGESLRARILTLELSRGDVRLDLLTPYQQDAARGFYARTTAAFVRWLATRYETIRKQWPTIVETLRADAPHPRTANMIAELTLALDYFLRFCSGVGALSGIERRCLFGEARAVLRDVAAAQSGHHAASEPAHRFCDLLMAAIASGRAHVAGTNGKAPTRPEAWGWRDEGHGWKPQGNLVGWRDDGGDLYLEPNAAYAAAERMGRDSGEPLSVSLHVLKQRLDEKGILVIEERGGRRRLEVRRTLTGQRRYVLYVRIKELKSLAGEDSADRAQEERTRSAPSGSSGPHGPQTDTGDQVKGQRRSSSFRTGESDSKLRAMILDMGKQLGWPEVPLSDEEVIPAGKKAWEQFCQETMGIDLHHAVSSVTVKRIVSGSTVRRART